MLRLALCVLFVYVSHVSALEDLSSVWNHGHHDQEVLGDNGSERGGASIGKTIMVPLQRKVLQSYGHYYFLNLSIGSPGQQLELFIDTGSSDTWVYDNSYCNGSTDYHYQCYIPEKSSTSKVLPAPPYFEPRYPGSKFQGRYVKDALTIGAGGLKQAEFGMLHDGNGPTAGGLLGLGFDVAEFGPNKTFGFVYPNVLDTLYNESAIDSRTFGLSLNDGSMGNDEGQGSLVLGGYDKSKYTEPLVEFAITSPSDVRRVSVPLTAIDATVAGLVVPIWTAASDTTTPNGFVPAALDSGDMNGHIPSKAHTSLLEALNRHRNGMFRKSKSGEPFDARMDCEHRSANVSVDFTLQGLTAPLTISVPFSHLVLPSIWDDGCLFALLPKSATGKAPFWLNLGSSIVASMYLLVDYDANTIHIARARYESGRPDLLPISHRPNGLF